MGASSKLGSTVDILQEKIGNLQKSRMKVSVLGRKGLEKMMIEVRAESMARARADPALPDEEAPSVL